MSNPYELQNTSVRHSKEEAYTECAQEVARMRKTVKEGRETYEEVFWDFYVAADLLWLLTRGNLRSKCTDDEYNALSAMADTFLDGKTPTNANKRVISLSKSVADGLKFTDCLLNTIDKKGVIIS